jgi:hypothetical protein
VKKIPSYVASLIRNADSISLSVGIVFIMDPS